MRMLSGVFTLSVPDAAGRLLRLATALKIGASFCPCNPNFNAVHESPLLVEVAAEANDDAGLGRNTQVRLCGRIAPIPTSEVVRSDTLQAQGCCSK